MVDGSTVHVFTADGGHEFRLPEPAFARGGGASGVGGGVAPMPGVVEKVCVQLGEMVEAGQHLVVIIAMKMEVR